MVAIIPGRPVRNHGEAQGTGVGEITDDFVFLGSTSTLCKAFVESTHCLWSPSPGATVLALTESKVMAT